MLHYPCDSQKITYYIIAKVHRSTSSTVVREHSKFVRSRKNIYYNYGFQKEKKLYMKRTLLIFSEM